MTHLASLYRYFTPRDRTRHLDWARRHARNTDGRPFSHEHYPHLGSPGGPCDALDDPEVRRIWLQFGSRLGKTFLGQCAMMKKADSNPGPMMFASSVEKVASDVIERTYSMIEQSPRVSPQLRPKVRRRQSCIDFDACQCFVAWSRSVSTLADKEVEFGHGNEIDKWEHQSTSKEADPLKLFLDRFKNRPHHKVILESTPTIKGKSRIETGRLGSTNCQFYVPCPHCERYQRLDLDRIKWDHLESGKSDKDLARRTAKYECEHCGEVIQDHHRPVVLRLGVWCPEGCKVKDVEAKRAAEQCAATDGGYEWHGWAHADWIEGCPLRDGPDAGYQLSSLYALSLAWGDIAAEFVSSKEKTQDLRNFVNQWKADTWETVHRKTTWEQLGARIILPGVKRGLVPNGFSFLTAGVDRQAEHLVWVIDAWGPERASHTVDYGTCDAIEDLLNLVIERSFAHQDRGPTLQVQLTLIDSGYHPKDIYEFCKSRNQKGQKVWPCKGSNTALNTPYLERRLGDDTLMPGAPIIHVDSLSTQDWLQQQLTMETGPGAGTLFEGSLWEHQDYLEQLLNDSAVVKLGTNKVDREVWERIDENTPNDYRDCRRYAYAAMLRVTRGAAIRPRAVAQPQRQEDPPPTKSNVFQRRGGWMPSRRG